MKTIQVTDEQFALLQEMSLHQGGFKICKETKTEIEKWQPKGGKWFVNIFGKVATVPWTLDSDVYDFGMAYPTKEAAEKARDAIRIHNRLITWLAENDDGWVADWSNSGQDKYYVYSKCTPEGEVCDFSADYGFKDISKIYMSRENAITLCKLLNEGVVEL